MTLRTERYQAIQMFFFMTYDRLSIHIVGRMMNLQRIRSPTKSAAVAVAQTHDPTHLLPIGILQLPDVITLPTPTISKSAHRSLHSCRCPVRRGTPVCSFPDSQTDSVRPTKVFFRLYTTGTAHRSMHSIDSARTMPSLLSYRSVNLLPSPRA